MNRFVLAAELKARGISLQYDSDYGEYRVCPRNGGESAAYYTDDIADARDTGFAMARERDRAAVEYTALFNAALPVDWASL